MAGESVLILEEDPIEASRLQTVLAGWGYQASVAPSAGRSLESLRDIRADLVLMDIHMNGGRQNAQKPERMQPGMEVPAIFLTRDSEEPFPEKVRQPHSYGCLRKPVEEDVLRASIETALYRSRLDKQLHQCKLDLEKTLELRTRELQKATAELEEMNTVLRVLMKKGDEDSKELQERMLSNVRLLVFPYIERLKESRLNEELMTCVNMLESQIREIVSPFVKNLSNSFLDLTPTEIRVAEMIKTGMQTKEIAKVLHLAPSTILTHRENLRKKLGLVSKKMNLRSYLQRLE